MVKTYFATQTTTALNKKKELTELPKQKNYGRSEGGSIVFRRMIYKTQKIAYDFRSIKIIIQQIYVKILKRKRNYRFLGQFSLQTLQTEPNTENQTFKKKKSGPNQTFKKHQPHGAKMGQITSVLTKYYSLLNSCHAIRLYSGFRRDYYCVGPSKEHFGQPKSFDLSKAKQDK